MYIAARGLKRKELERYARFTSLVSGTLVGLFGLTYIMYRKMSVDAADEEPAEVFCLCLKYYSLALMII